MMNDLDQNKQLIQDFIQAVWMDRDLDALGNFWAQDCVNHAVPGTGARGLDATRAYHEQFFAALAAFSNIRIEIQQQVAEGDLVVTRMESRGEHVGPFSGIPPTGKSVSLATIRIDRIRDGKIAEHWVVSSIAGLMRHLQG